MRYRREVDGLRALAVLPVIFFHAQVEAFSGGYVGVDIFFVISGYLITGLIVEEKQAGRFSLLTFYERRARRILPALFVVTLACLPAAYVLMVPYLLENFGKSVIAVWLFASNFLFWRESDYFDPAADENPLLHTWSLAVEEQYYLLFPALIAAFWSGNRRKLALAITAAALLSLLSAEWGWRNSPIANFYLAPTRAWELFIGAMLALWKTGARDPVTSKFIRELCGLLGLAMIAFAIFAFDDVTPFPSFYALIPTAGTALVLAFADSDTFLGRVLGSRALVSIGLVSYSLYLWHQPLFTFARMVEDPSTGTYLLLILTAIVLAYLTWRFVENPFRNRSFLSRKTVFALSFGAIGFFVLAGSTLRVTDGFDSRLTQAQRQLLSWRQHQRGDEYRQGKCFLLGDVPHSRLAQECITPVTGNSVFLWGDSHAAHLFPGLAAHGLHVSQVTTGGCPPVPGYQVGTKRHCKETNAFVADQLSQLKGQSVLLAANWRVYSVRSAFREALDRQLASYASSDNRFVLVGPVPQWSPSLPEVAARHVDGEVFPELLESSALFELRRVDDLLQRMASKHGIEYVSLIKALCDETRCRAAADRQGNVPMSWDRAHLTSEGSGIAAAYILTELGKMPNTGH